MTEPVLHGECPQCGSCWGCWEQTVTTLRELLFSVTEDRDRLRDKYEPTEQTINELAVDRDRWRKIAEELAAGAYSVSYGRLRDALDAYEKASTNG